MAATMNVTTLIPAYKTGYMPELLVGLASQTRPSARVIVSDDSPGGEFGALLHSPPFAALRGALPLEIHRGPQSGAYQNFKHLVKLWNGSSELVHLLLDDDVIYPDFYDLHLTTHRSGRFSSTISGRWTAAKTGQPVSGMPVPQDIQACVDRVVVLNAAGLFRTTVPRCTNWLGEFSNCVMSAECARLLHEPHLAGVSYAGLWDVGTFLAASTRAPVAYLQDRLGCFRTGGGGHSGAILGKYMKAAHLGFAALAIGGQRLGHLSDEEAAECFERVAAVLHQRYTEEEDMRPFCAILPEMAAGGDTAGGDFLGAWSAFLAANTF